MSVRPGSISQRTLYFWESLVAVLLLSLAFADASAGQALTLVQIAEQQSPTVVTITTEDGFGSGVIVEATGLIVTSLHVIQGSLSAEVRLSNGDVYDDITVSAVDPRRDLALIRIRGFGLPSASFGNSELVRPGDSVILIGAPEGLEQTVSNGIVSALRDSGDGYRFIQTTAPASPGSSGSGMFSESGELIGIVTSQFTAGQNLNFAVPINYARGLLSSDNEMTLADAAIHYPREEPASQTAATSSQPNSTSAYVEQLKAAVKSSGVSYQSIGDDTWRIDYRDGTYLDAVTVVVSVFTDMALFQAIVAKQPTSTDGLAAKLLTLSWQQNLVKIGLDPSGDLLALQEFPIQMIDGETVNLVADAVAAAADEAARVLVDIPVLKRLRDLTFISRGDEIDVIEVLGGAAIIRYQNSSWEEQDFDDVDGRLFFNESDLFFVALIDEASQIPIDSMPDIAMMNLREVGTDVIEIMRGERNINGNRFTFIEYSANIGDLEVAYLGLYYSDASGTLQIVGWSTSNIFGGTRGKIERFASGFFLTSQGGDALSSNVATLSGGSAAGELQAQFGLFVPDAAGNTSFVETRSIPNTAGQSFGWFIEVGAVSDPIWWTEQLMLPEAPASWGELGSQANVSISRDRRTITTRDESEAIDGWIYNMWEVIEDDPSGQYSIRVTLSDGRSTEFLFAVE